MVQIRHRDPIGGDEFVREPRLQSADEFQPALPHRKADIERDRLAGDREGKGPLADLRLERHIVVRPRADEHPT